MYQKFLDQWKDDHINRLHFHFSGHGFYNQTVDVQRNEFDEVDSAKSTTPIGECVVGNNGRDGLCSILQIQYLLSRIKAEKITITLDCCRSLDRELGKTRERVKLVPMPKVDKNNWLRIATIQGSCKTLPAYDINSFTKELFIVLNQHNGRILIEKMDEIVNNSWYIKGINQLCQMEIIKVGNNWKDLYWPI